MKQKFEKSHPAWTGWSLAIPILLLAACQPAVQSTTQVTNQLPPLTASPTHIPTATPLETVTSPPDGLPPMPAPTQGEGLTYEQMLNTTPPAPVDFTAVIRENVIRLAWAPAPPAALPHAYSDRIIGYNIYRYEQDQTSLTLLASVDGLFYEDKSASPGVTYHYSVSAVHEGPLEGQRTNEVTITAP